MTDIEKEIQELKDKVNSFEKKDLWDKLKIVTGILLPLAIVHIGNAFTSSQTESENRSNEIIAELQRELSDKQFEYQKQISTINSKVGQVTLVANFFDALLSEDPVRKKLAIKAVLIALKDEGPELVKIIEESDDESDIKSFAQETLKAKRMELVELLFSKSKHERINAYNDIISGWKNDPEMIKEILDFGASNLSNQNGVYNSLITLLYMNKTALSPYKDAIIEYSNKTEANGTKTQERAKKLRLKI